MGTSPPEPTLGFDATPKSAGLAGLLRQINPRRRRVIRSDAAIDRPRVRLARTLEWVAATLDYARSEGRVEQINPILALALRNFELIQGANDNFHERVPVRLGNLEPVVQGLHRAADIETGSAHFFAERIDNELALLHLAINGMALEQAPKLRLGRHPWKRCVDEFGDEIVAAHTLIEGLGLLPEAWRSIDNEQRECATRRDESSANLGVPAYRHSSLLGIADPLEAEAVRFDATSKSSGIIALSRGVLTNETAFSGSLFA